ncbi:MAG TPA: hypothetical protein VMM12_09270 [Longimicrobiales bacterium]|nr:hypothetical protein [Longimicrobiales bacterium]
MRNRAKAGLVAAVALMAAGVPGDVASQGTGAEAAMVAAGEWVRGRLPAGSVRLDPHRTGRSTDRAVAARVASALGAELGTLEQSRACADVADPSTCRLDVAVLLAIAEPAIRGDRAVVRAYAWYRQNDPRSPVGKGSWEVTLRRTASGWAVEGEQRLD